MGAIHVYHGDHVVHLHDAFKESEHPREKGGKFTKGAGAARGAVKKVAQLGKRAAGEFSKEDYHILRNNLHAPHSAPRRSVAEHIRNVARSGKQLIQGHLREMKEDAVHSVGALKALSKGQRPSKEQFRGLRRLGTSIAISAGSAVLSGDVTGTLPHMISVLATEFGQHAALEHTAKLGAGLGRFALAGAMGGGDSVYTGDADLSDQDYELLQHYLETLADVVERMHVPDSHFGG